MNELFSIVIPTLHKTSKELKYTIESLKKQTYNNIEIIIINESDANKTHITKDIRSLQRNIGIKRAHGKYIMTTDSDFVFDNTLIERAIQKLNEGYDAIIYQTTEIDKSTCRKHNLDINISIWANIRKAERNSYNNIKFGAPAIFKREIILSVNGFDEDSYASEEYILKQKLIKRHYKIGLINEHAYHIGSPKTLAQIVIKNIHYGKNLKHAINELHDPVRNPVRIKTWFYNRKEFATPVLMYGFMLYKYVQLTSNIIGMLLNKMNYDTT